MIRFSLLTRDWPWKLFSLCAAVLLWNSVARDPELVSFISVPVQYQRVPGGLEISSEVVEHVNLELQGGSGVLSRLDQSKPRVILDFSRVSSPGERTFDIDEKTILLPHGVRLVRAIPSQLRFGFERRSRAQVPVEIRFTGKLPAGFELLRYEVEPHRVVVEGPESRVQQSPRVETDPVDLSQAGSLTEFRVNTFADDPHLRFLGSPHVTVRLFVEKK